MKGQEIDLTRYVSNLDRNVYTIYNLPEEVIAVIFAYVSRSPLSFRDNLKKLLEDDELAVGDAAGGIASFYSEKAARFHEKWVVGYGHSSVAEHAVAHIGIERISRLASAELELANSFNSFTEYSQRYQRPRRGDWYLPP
ncbi:MAG: FAD-dependent thymidylate synthase, partial [Planifilum fulgidum]